MNWPFAELKTSCRAEMTALASAEIHDAPHRLEAGFYASEGYKAVQAMEASGFEIGRVGKLADVKWFGPFARRYVTDPERGVPFLSSSDMMESRPRDYHLSTYAKVSCQFFYPHPNPLPEGEGAKC